METLLKSEWTEYNHDYEKKIQDIRLKNGDEVMKCYPNAGKWMCLSANKKYKEKDIPDSEVTHTRLTKGEN